MEVLAVRKERMSRNVFTWIIKLEGSLVGYLVKWMSEDGSKVIKEKEVESYEKAKALMDEFTDKILENEEAEGFVSLNP